MLATFTVNSLGDAGIGSSDSGDLRYCINQANADDQANTIVFDSTVFGTPQTITLTGGQLELKDTGGTQTITGPAAGVTISGGGTSRVFRGRQWCDRLALRPDHLRRLDLSGNGGGLVNYGTVTLTDCTLSGNYRLRQYGARPVQCPTANLTMTGCTVSGNSTAPAAVCKLRHGQPERLHLQRQLRLNGGGVSNNPARPT